MVCRRNPVSITVFCAQAKYEMHGASTKTSESFSTYFIQQNQHRKARNLLKPHRSRVTLGNLLKTSTATFDFSKKVLLILVSCFGMNFFLASIHHWISHAAIIGFVVHFGANTTTLTVIAPSFHFLPHRKILIHC